MVVDGPMFAKRSRPFGSSSSSVVPAIKKHRKYKAKGRNEEAAPRTQPMVSDGSSVDSVLHRDYTGGYDQQAVEKEIAKKLKKLEKKAKKREVKAKRKLQEKVKKARLKLEKKARQKQKKLERKAASDLAEYERWANAFRRPISVQHNSRSGSMLAIGGDSLLSILSFLDMKDLALVEMVSLGMQRAALQRYESIDVQTISNKSRAGTAKKRAIRYYFASTYAREMEPLVPRHLASTEDESDHLCTGGGRCQFPSSLFTNPSPDTHELFVRFAKNVENNNAGSPQLIIEGFTKFVLDGSRVIFDIGAMDLSAWPDMRTVIDWSNNSGDDDISDNIWDDDAPPFDHLILKSLVATVVAVEKESGKVYLVNGTHNDPTDPHLDHYHLPSGRHSFCTTNDLRTAPHSPRCNVTFNWEFVWSNGGTLECHLSTLK